MYKAYSINDLWHVKVSTEIPPAFLWPKYPSSFINDLISMFGIVHILRIQLWGGRGFEMITLNVIVLQIPLV